MSTRSGKRIHATVDSPTVETEIVLQSERKTRSKKQKENVELSVKKRHNYVSYPADEDTASVSSEATETQEKVKRTGRLRRNTLKELNAENAGSGNIALIECTKSVRKSRRGKKLLEEPENTCDIENIQIFEHSKSIAADKQKSKKKKSHKKVPVESAEVQELHNHDVRKKVINKKKRSNSFERNGKLNIINMSVESFHSAAGSPVNENLTENIDQESGNFIQYESKNSPSQTLTESADGLTNFKNSLVAAGKKEEKSSIKNSSINKNNAKSVYEENLNTSFNKTTKELPGLTSTGDISTQKRRRSHKKNSTFDKIEIKDADKGNHNETINKANNVPKVYDSDLENTKRRKSSIKNSTFDKIETENPGEDNLSRTYEKINETITVLNSEVDVSIKKRKNSNIKNSTFDKIETKDVDNTTFEKTNETASVFESELPTSTRKRRKSSIKNSTFDKTEINGVDIDNLNTTYDKTLEFPGACSSEVEVSRRKRRKTIVKNSMFDQIESKDVDEENLNTTLDKTNEVQTDLNTEVDRKRKKSTQNNFVYDKIGTGETITANSTMLDCYSAAGSFISDDATNKADKTNGELNLVKSNDFKDHCDNDLNTTVNKKNNKERKFSLRNSMIDNIEKNFEDPLCAKDTNITFETVDAIPQNSTYDKESSLTSNFIQDITNTTDKDSKNNVITKCHDNEVDKHNIMVLNTTFDTDRKADKSNDSKKSSLISSDATINSTFDNSRISITSDESKTENILNHTPVLIESSIDDSRNLTDKTPEKSVVPLTPLKRESTFTKDEPNTVTSPESKFPEKTPVKRKSSPGRTPHPVSKSSQKKRSIMNVTRSIEKPSLEVGQRQTRVMFCSPVNNPIAASHVKGRVIKSNLKGSNKSFVFDDSVLGAAPASRKRSLTLGDEARAKRSRLAGTLQHSVERLSRPRTLSAAAKLPDPGTPSKKTGAITPSKAKPEARVSRTRLPNFAALHQKQFARMESLDECQARKAQRAKQLLTPNGCVAMLERISPKGTPPQPAPPPKESTCKLQTPTNPKLLTLESLNPGYTRFGFKLKTDVNPFSMTNKTEAKKERPNGMSRQNLSRQTNCLALPSLAGATINRRDVAKQTVMREKSFTEKRDVTRKETRTIIKGVRTNRRFDLQMKLRNIDA